MLRVVRSSTTKYWINFICTPFPIWRISSQKIHKEKVKLYRPANTFPSQSHLRKLEAVGYVKASCRAKQLILNRAHKQNNHSTDCAVLPNVLCRCDEKGSPCDCPIPPHPHPLVIFSQKYNPWLVLTGTSQWTLGASFQSVSLYSNPQLHSSLCSPPPAI